MHAGRVATLAITFALQIELVIFKILEISPTAITTQMQVRIAFFLKLHLVFCLGDISSRRTDALLQWPNKILRVRARAN